MILSNMEMRTKMLLKGNSDLRKKRNWMLIECLIVLG